MRIHAVAGVLFLALLSGCDSAVDVNSAASVPLEPDGDAIGYYCNMMIVNHDGPKGQVHVAAQEQPLWFASVRDTLAFTQLPGEPKNLRGIFVNDMTNVVPGQPRWRQPQPGTWINARQAWYVVDAPVRGGMGAPEPVPFEQREAADRFAADYGGRVLAFGEIQTHDVIGSSATAGADMQADLRSRGTQQ